MKTENKIWGVEGEVEEIEDFKLTTGLFLATIYDINEKRF